MGAFHFRCIECSAPYDEERGLLVCPVCSARQTKGDTTRGVLETVVDGLPSNWPDAEITRSEFLTRFWPVDGDAFFPPLPAGGTPLLEVPRLAAAFGIPNLRIKDDSRNPSGSTKDRASFLVVAKAREYGYDTVAAASTGNAATALAAMAAASSIRSVVFVPASAPRAKLIQMLSYGAVVLLVEGTYDDAFELCRNACEAFGWYNRNTALNPFTIEGKKTAALEIAAQMTPDVPDAVVVPTGDGVILSGVAKGFRDLLRGGLIDRMPRLIAVQPEGSSAIATALISGADSISRVPGAASVADSLTVEVPRSSILCLESVRMSHGGGVIVTDREIIRGISELAELTGIFAEPAAAAVVPGLKRALNDGLVDRNEKIVLLVTGTGLKDIGAAMRAVDVPPSIRPHLEEVRGRLRSD
jgi:threonine synthase